MGYEEYLPSHTQDAVKRAIEQTAQNDGLVLNFALNYGSRAEIITAIKQMANEVKEDELDIETIDDDVVGEHLMTGFLPKELRDPELVVRTSGEERISNLAVGV